MCAVTDYDTWIVFQDFYETLTGKCKDAGEWHRVERKINIVRFFFFVLFVFCFFVFFKRHDSATGIVRDKHKNTKIDGKQHFSPVHVQTSCPASVS